jgi:hypothetical protein
MMTTPPSDPTGNNKEQQRQESFPRRFFSRPTASEQPKSDEVQPGGVVAESEPKTEKPAEPKEERPRRRFQFMPAFWTITGALSLVVNIILIIVIVVLINNLFSLRAIIKDQLIDGLAANFKLMDQAKIQTSVSVSTKVPAKFTLNLDTDTTVKLIKDTPIKGAKVTIIAGVLTIKSAPTDIILPAGTDLPIHLNLQVPVDQQIPVDLVVPVNIPLNQTELHKPFVGLQNVVLPYQNMLAGTPTSWREAICGAKPEGLCDTLLPESK